MDESDDVQGAFARQRRFLMIVSCALALWRFIGVHPTTISVLGNDLAVDEPGRLYWIGVAMWAWSVWRYCAYFGQLQLWQASLNTLRRKMTEALRRGYRLAPEDVPDETVKELHKDLYDTAIPIHVVPEDVVISAEMTPDQSSLPRAVEVEVGARYPMVGERPSRRIILPLPFATRLKLSIVGVASLFASSSAGTEYLAPFAFAALPAIAEVLYWTCSNQTPSGPVWV